MSPESGVFDGMTRRTVMELCAATNVKAMLGAVKADDRGRSLSDQTAGGIIPITKVDDQLIGNGSPGPLTLRLLYWALHDNPKYTTPVAYD